MRPALLVIGAQKAGTSALFHMLSAHPQVLPPIRKELDHFAPAGSYDKGLRHYLSQFPVKPLRSIHCVSLEASTSYLYFSGFAAPRIAKDLPDAICLAILRDPVKRAYSAWNMCRDFVRKPNPKGLPELRTFAQAVDDELAGRTADPRHMYLLRSKYTSQVADFKQHIAPEKLLIRSYLQLKHDPASVVNELAGLLGLSVVDPSNAMFNIRSNERSYPEPLDPALAKELHQYFVPELERLNKMLGYAFEIMEGDG